MRIFRRAAGRLQEIPERAFRVTLLNDEECVFIEDEVVVLEEAPAFAQAIGEHISINDDGTVSVSFVVDNGMGGVDHRIMPINFTEDDLSLAIATLKNLVLEARVPLAALPEDVQLLFVPPSKDRPW